MEAIERPKSRLAVIVAVGALLAAFFLYAFWPRATPVDLGEATRGALTVTIDEDAKTRVRDAYVVSAPVAGRLLRVDVNPGDAVEADASVIARLLPATPPILDIRTEEQARAAIAAAEAALAFAAADARRARADADLRRSERDRARTLRAESIIAEAALDRAETAWRAAKAAFETTNASVAMREADLESARAMLIRVTGKPAPGDNPHAPETIDLVAPISGRVLRVHQESERTVPAGTPIVEIGDPLGDLEIVAELLSTDAVQVSAGDVVLIDRWGGGEALHGVVARVEPWGFTKVSALGVEEQRVNVIITFTDEPAARERLGPGYRVDVRIVIWSDDAALKAPSNALFRNGEDWALFRAENGRARLTRVVVGRSNGVETEIRDGLKEGDRIVLYPGQRTSDGLRITPREPR